jgi:anti-anti-sigma factor
MIEIVKRSDAEITCRPTGDLDEQAATLLRHALRVVIRPGIRLVVDLRQAGYADAAGVAALAAVVRHAQAFGGGARVVNARPRVIWRLQLAGIDPSRLPSMMGRDASAA